MLLVNEMVDAMNVTCKFKSMPTTSNTCHVPNITQTKHITFSPLCWDRTIINKPHSNASIVLSIQFQEAYVRRRYKQAPKFAYLRELNRIKYFLKSAKNVKTQLPITVLVGGLRYYNHEDELKREGVRIVPMSTLNPPKWASIWHMQSFNKLNAIRLTQYEKVIMLDNDVVLWKNIDHLSRIKTPAAVWVRPDEFNSGVMVLSPSADETLTQNYTRMSAGKDKTKGDQESWLNHYKHWNILPIGYNAHRGICMSDEEWKKVKIVHVINGYEYRRESPSWTNKYVKTFMRRRK